mmetsp:Transcript_14422/g.25942  ORF Transcript_14422/g.25942 Transcript_14422/m.25942 type:complete len:206 (+) Transcript_14422:45-662(+)
MKRLFDLLDYNVTGQVNFEQYLFGIYLLKFANTSMRKRLAFEFCDMDGDGAVSRSDLRKSLLLIHRLYNGKFEDQQFEQQEVDKFVEAMFEFALLSKASMRKSPPKNKNRASGRRGSRQSKKNNKKKQDTSPQADNRSFLERERFRSLKANLGPEEFGEAVDRNPLVLLFFNLHEDDEVRKLRSDLIAEAKGDLHGNEWMSDNEL